MYCFICTRRRTHISTETICVIILLRGIALIASLLYPSNRTTSGKIKPEFSMKLTRIWKQWSYRGKLVDFSKVLAVHHRTLVYTTVSIFCKEKEASNYSSVSLQIQCMDPFQFQFGPLRNETERRKCKLPARSLDGKLVMLCFFRFFLSWLHAEHLFDVIF